MAVFFRCCILLVSSALLLTSCSGLTLPRLEWDEQRNDPSVPLRVKLELDSSVRQAAFPYNDACGNPQVFQVGSQLSHMLREDSEKIFQQVVTQDDLQVGNFVDATLHYTVLTKSYNLAIPRLESWSEYPANATLRIRAFLREKRTGKEVYSEIFEGHGDWKVSTDDAGNDCEPIGIGIPIDETLEAISDELVKTMRNSGRLQLAASQLVEQRQLVAGGAPQPLSSSPPIPVAAPNPSTSTSPLVHERGTPAVQFRTKLVDANRNLVLEGGEAVKLLLEVHNVSHAPISSAYVELRGTPVLVEAFKRVVSLPVPLGMLKVGEKRTAEIRGRLPRIRKQLNGELIIGIILSEGLPPSTHSILAEITPFRASKKTRK